MAPRTEAVILESNIPVIEAGIDVWANTGTYLSQATVQVNGTTHKIYKSIKAGGEAISPELDVDDSGTGEYWKCFGATNYKRAFDELSSSKCSNPLEIYYKFQVSDIDLLMLDGLVGDTLRIKVTNTENSVAILDETTEISFRDVGDWFDWTYAVPTQQKSHFKLLPMAFNATLEVWITKTEGAAEVGHIPYGRSRDYGLTLADPQPVTSRRGITSKSRDTFGNIVTRRKARYKRMKISCIIDSSRTDNIEDRLDELADTPLIAVGDERDGGYKALLLYAELKDHDMPIGITKTVYQLEFEGYL